MRNDAAVPAISSDQLAAFVKVAERLSVSAAADELGVGKSQVSKRIAQLEDCVGATLFSRSTRKIALTPAGEAYLEHARRALGELGTGEERLRALRSDLSGHIRLTAPVSWGQHVLAKRLPEFLRRHPGITLELQLADRRMDLAGERIDVALRWSATTATHLSAVPVARVGWIIVAAPAWLATAGPLQTPADLAEQATLCYWRESSDESWVLSHTQRGDMVEVRVRGRYHVDNPDAVTDAACAGLGVALLPDYLCAEALASGRLVRVLSEWTPQTRFGTRITALATPERMALRRNRMLIEFLQAACEV